VRAQVVSEEGSPPPSCGRRARRRLRSTARRAAWALAHDSLTTARDRQIMEAKMGLDLKQESVLTLLCAAPPSLSHSPPLSSAISPSLCMSALRRGPVLPPSPLLSSSRTTLPRRLFLSTRRRDAAFWGREIALSRDAVTLPMRSRALPSSEARAAARSAALPERGIRRKCRPDANATSLERRGPKSFHHIAYELSRNGFGGVHSARMRIWAQMELDRLCSPQFRPG
jgi:hypothetical protein